MQTKPFYASKLFWLNLIATITAVLEVVRVLNIPAEVLQYGAVAVAVLNIIIRVWYTDTAIFAKPKDTQL